MVVIGSVEVAQDLLERRGALYSNRPPSFIADYIGYTKTIPGLDYNDTAKQVRRMFNKAIGTRALMEVFIPLMS